MTRLYIRIVLAAVFVVASQGNFGPSTSTKADWGDAEAQHLLGDIYASGGGVPQNDAEAVKWYLWPLTKVLHWGK